MLPLDIDADVLDIVGTGGDGYNTVNISTAASIVAASCGMRVAKHGSRAVSSKCGSSNVLQQFGINLDMQPAHVVECINSVGIGFCFAPRFHPAWVKVKEVRAMLGVRTVFNILGPLLNPARANYMLLGVFSENLLGIMAETLQTIGVKHALVVHGNGLDELTLSGINQVVEVTPAETKRYQLDPTTFGFDMSAIKDIEGGEPALNAQLIKAVFDGEKGPIADTIIFNAGAALYAADQVASIAGGIDKARKAVKRGKAAETLNNWVKFCKKTMVY